MKKYFNFSSFLLFLIFFSSCSTKTTQTSSPNPYGVEDNLQIAAKVYPAPGDSLPPTSVDERAYPAPEIKDLSSEKIIRFKLDKPIFEGTTELSGKGPAGIPILVADVTFLGEIIAKGVIGPDGTFLIELSVPLERAHRIGIALGDLDGTPWEKIDLSDPAFFGDEFQQIPMIGFFYDTTLVQAKNR